MPEKQKKVCDVIDDEIHQNDVISVYLPHFAFNIFLL